MSRILKLILVVLSVGVTIVLLPLVLGGSIAKRQCQNQLRSIGCVIALYRQTHDGAYPPNLEEIENGVLKSVLHCPGVRNRGVETGDTLPDGSDYIYVNWPQQLRDGEQSLPAKYPLVYDARISNHKGKGINILLIDGSVIWDEEARWITRFAIDHKGIRCCWPKSHR